MLSPKSHSQVVMFPSVSVDLSVNWIILSVVGNVGKYEKFATGNLLFFSVLFLTMIVVDRGDQLLSTLYVSLAFIFI